MAGDGIGLVADIGRQSVRFALSGGAAGIAPRETRSYHTADHATFTSALLAYLAEVGQRDAVLPSVLAVAGAARGDLINLTGSRWYISLSGRRGSAPVPPTRAERMRRHRARAHHARARAPSRRSAPSPPAPSSPAATISSSASVPGLASRR